MVRRRGGGSRGWIRELGAPQLFVLSFLLLIILGTAGFLWLPGIYTGERLGFVDALFTATSAVCVTGLIVVDTATWFTPLGQAWVAALIQAGGLGMLTLTTLVITGLGGRPGLEMEEAAGAAQAPLDYIRRSSLLRTVVGVTLLLEAVGAASLWWSWQGHMGATAAIWPAVFHAISAFCNAGFSIFSDSLAGVRDPATLSTVSFLVVVGGLGFLTFEDLRARYVLRTTRRLSVHTLLVLGATALLLLAPIPLFLAFEWQGELAGMSWWDRIANAGFMSVTARTAGFNTVDYGAVTNPSLFLTILLMAVGGSPGSTAGGFKTVTLAILVLALWARLRGDDRVMVFQRSIPRDTVLRAAGVVAGGVMILASTVFLLLLTEPLPGTDREAFLHLVFEAHSAFGTVGLSMGATDSLTPAGRLLLTAVMLLGRIGPLAAVSAMVAARRRRIGHFRYGQEDVMLG
jgi:trk system potassium uptake protein